MLDSSILIGLGGTPTTTEAPRVLASGLSSRDTTGSDETTRVLAAVIALQSSLDRCTSVAETCQNAAEMIRHHLDANRVLLLWRDNAGQPMVIVGDSIDQQSDQTVHPETVPLIIAAGEEIAARGTSARFPATDPMERHALMAVAQMVRHLSVEVLHVIPLCDDQDRDWGTLLVIDTKDSHCEEFLSVASRPLTSTVHRIARLQPSWAESFIRGLRHGATGKRRAFLRVAAMFVMAMMILPVQYQVVADVELQPIQRRFVAAPFDGPLQHVHAKPGDLVETGDLLAEINPREIEFELAGSLAQLNRAKQERKSMMAAHDFAGGKIAELEVERIRNETQLLQHQRDHLQIRSPLSGVVISGDLTRSEGMPMSRGETLFEIAPLGEMIVEIAVPESELAQVRVGMPMTMFLHAFPNRDLGGTVEQIHPIAELRNHQNVFVAEVRLRDVDGLYRPGMRGRARIASDRHPLAWNLFHRPFYALMNWIGW